MDELTEGFYSTVARLAKLEKDAEKKVTAITEVELSNIPDKEGEMSVETIIICDECEGRSDMSEAVYCYSCYSNLQNEIQVLERKRSKLKDEIDYLSEEVARLEPGE